MGDFMKTDPRKSEGIGFEIENVGQNSQKKTSIWSTLRAQMAKSKSRPTPDLILKISTLTQNLISDCIAKCKIWIYLHIKFIFS